MYTLLSGLYKYMFQKDEYCILILGLDNAGKTVRACSASETPRLSRLGFTPLAACSPPRENPKPV